MTKTEHQSKTASASQNARTEAELDAAFDNYDGCPTAGSDLAKHGLTRETEKASASQNPRTFRWSNRNIVDGWWKTFYYCKGQGFDLGLDKYYGCNQWRTERAAIEAQERWETRIGQ